MKYFIRIAVFLVTLFACGYLVMGLYLLGSNKKRLLTENEKLEESIIRYKNAAVDVSAGQSVAGFNTNTEMIKAILDIESVSFVSATAQIKNKDGTYNSVISVADVSDVSYFTNTIDYVLVTVSFKKLQKTLSNFESLHLPFDYLDIDRKSKTFTVRLPAVKTSDSEISSEFTDSPPTQVSDNEIQYVGGDEVD